MSGFDLTCRAGPAGHMESHVCLRRTGILGVTFGESQLEHGTQNDSRRKCHVALLQGLFVAPLGGSGGHPEGLLIILQLTQAGVPNIYFDVDSCYLVWV